MKKILTVVGARPQFIKAAVVSRAFKKHDDIEEIIVHTGQHYDPNMSDVFFREMDIPEPKYRLLVNNMSHGAMTGRMLEKTEEVIKSVKPDLVLVYGDTNSTLAGALAATKLNIPLAHVEAGLRSFNMKMPEEINRILTDRISTLLFCPTTNAVNNLNNEAFNNFNCHIFNTGDVMYEAALYYKQFSGLKSSIIKDHNLQDEEFVLCTVHRQENTDNIDNLNAIINALNDINKHVRVVLPLHPRTKNIIEKNHIRTLFEIIEPVGYFDIIELLRNCQLVLTDSGGMQKEAYFFRKYCITLREETEWTELVENGCNFLAGHDKEKIREVFDNIYKKKLPGSISLYGKGDAGLKIANHIRDFL